MKTAALELTARNTSKPGLMRRFELRCLATLLAVFGAVSCAPDSALVPEAQFRTKIVGDWIGTVGDMKETMTFRSDGGFVSTVRPVGFISNTLGQGVTGTIRGTWAIQGKVVTLNITSAENDSAINKTTSSTIVSFTQNELVVKSALGDTSTFVRAL